MKEECMKRLAKRMIFTMVMLTMLLLTGTTVYAAKKVTIKASNVSMTSTQKKQLKVTTSPSKAKLTFTSSDSSIVAVSSKGLLTGKKAGTAKVTIKAAKKGSYQANTRTITVTVKKTVNSVTALDLKVKVGTTVSAQANAQQQTAVGQLIQSSDLLGHDQRITEGQNQQSGADLQSGGALSDGSQLQQGSIVAGRLTVELFADIVLSGDVVVAPDRVEAQLLSVDGQIDDVASRGVGDGVHQTLGTGGNTQTKISFHVFLL